MQILTGVDPGFHISVKPWLRADLVEFGLQFRYEDLGDSDRADLQYIFDDNNEFVLHTEKEAHLDSIHYIDSSRTFYIEKIGDGGTEDLYTQSKHPWFNTFYKTPANFFQVDTKDFYLRVNPLFDFSLGREGEEDVTLFYNRRGIALRGGIGYKVYFSTRIIENQARFPNYVLAYEEQFNAVPGAAFYKRYRSSIFDLPDSRDYLLADGYVGFDLTRHIGMQLGHGRNFIGSGMRSLLLSDFSPEYFYLKFNTRVWKLHYQNIFAELAAEGIRDQGSSQIVEKKYLAAHYLSFKPRENLEFGLFEGVVFYREKGGIELQYLNPVILFRTIEGSIGSPDNVLLGFNARWDFLNRFSVYGQFMLDDIQLSRLLKGETDWWGNKYGGQLGVKYINAFNVDHLDLQLEINQVRPYTYAHRDSTSSYTHYNQALSHPNGANFKEFIAKVHYRPVSKLEASLHFIVLNTGDDDGDINYGSNVVSSFNTRPSDFGIFTGQGVSADITTISVGINYMLRHNLYLDLRYHSRVKESEVAEKDLSTSFFMAGVRLGLGDKELLF